MLFAFSQENVRSRGARAPSAQTRLSLSQISLQRADFHPISKNLIRCVSFLPRRTHHNSFPPHGSIASTDRSIKILHGINVIRYVNKRYVVGCVHAWSQLNHGAYTQSGWEKNSSSSGREVFRKGGKFDHSFWTTIFAIQMRLLSFFLRSIWFNHLSMKNGSYYEVLRGTNTFTVYKH